MIALWIPATIAAAFLQNLRSAMQKAIKGRLSTTGAAYSRFLYAFPGGLLIAFLLSGPGGRELPAANGLFLVYAALGGACQILFTVVLLWMFSFRSFAVGTTFSKLEVILIAILGAILLGDTIGPIAIAAVAVSGIGTALLALSETRLSLKGLVRGLTEKATLIGLLSAAFLGASVVFFRGAILALDWPDRLMASSYALAVALTMQTAMMGAWFLAFDRAQLRAVLREWRRAAPVGLVGLLCSLCWFLAFSQENAAYVRALGQVELVFTFLASVFVFREEARRAEVAGILLIVAAIVAIVLGG